MAPLFIKFDLSTSHIILRNQALMQLLDIVKSQHLLISKSSPLLLFLATSFDPTALNFSKDTKGTNI